MKWSNGNKFVCVCIFLSILCDTLDVVRQQRRIDIRLLPHMVIWLGIEASDFIDYTLGILFVNMKKAFGASAKIINVAGVNVEP